jgi:hypothetical protein
MDRNEVRRRALMGAAKVAFSAALVGCGGVAIVEQPLGDGGSGGGATSGGETTSVGQTSAQSKSVATTGASSSTGLAANACGPAAPPYGADVIACCDALLDATFPEGAPATSPLGADVVACCDVALEVRDVETPPGEMVPGDAFPWNVAYQCCVVPGVAIPEPSSPTCTPWGPPVPPAMPADLDWLEEAA